MVHVGLAPLRAEASTPLDRDPRSPRPPARHDPVDLEVVVRIEPTEALEPAQRRFASMPLAAKRMIAGKDVMDVIRELIDDRRPLAEAQLLEDRGGASLDDRVVHASEPIPRRPPPEARDPLHPPMRDQQR